jgi:hypothetical protein
MKHAILKSIAHNIADSLASGIGLMIGVYQMDVFGEAAESPEGFIEVDFLKGVTSGAAPSLSLARAVHRYAEVLPNLHFSVPCPASIKTRGLSSNGV